MKWKRPEKVVAVLFLPVLVLGLAPGGPLTLSIGTPVGGADDPFGIGWMVGEWEGDGWVQFGPDRREAFRQRESVRRVLGGRALLLEGSALGMADGRVLEESGPVHQALAVITREPDTGRLALRAYRVDEGHPLAVDAEAEVVDGSLTWSFRDPAFGQMRYTIVRTDEGAWHETGHISPDGDRWFEFLEMKLRRVAPSG